MRRMLDWVDLYAAKKENKIVSAFYNGLSVATGMIESLDHEIVKIDGSYLLIRHFEFRLVQSGEKIS